jgi:ribosomal protein L37AE/L43A
MIAFIVLGVLAVPAVFAWSLCRIAADADNRMDVWDVEFCPHCDSERLEDWGEGGWRVCQECHMMFDLGEDRE